MKTISMETIFSLIILNKGKEIIVSGPFAISGIIDEIHYDFSFIKISYKDFYKKLLVDGLDVMIQGNRVISYQPALVIYCEDYIKLLDVEKADSDHVYF